MQSIEGLCFLKEHKHNMKSACREQSRTVVKHHLLLIFRVNSWFKWNKKMRNKANLTSAEFTLTPEIKGGYSNLHPKIKNGTKPNKANSRNGKSAQKQEHPKKKQKNEKQSQFTETHISSGQCFCGGLSEFRSTIGAGKSYKFSYCPFVL